MARVLLVDNDATTVSLLKILLELDGHEVSVCSSPKVLIETIGAGAPDLVLMDVFLTGADGLDLLRQIRAESRFDGTPVIMTSGMELSEECAQAGANGFLLKPYTPENLTEVIKTSLDNRPGGPRRETP